MLTSETIGIIITVSKGLIKLSKRVDLQMAEKTAVNGPLAVKLPKMTKAPAIPYMRRVLNDFLDQNRSELSGTDVKKIEAILSHSRPFELKDAVDQYAPEAIVKEYLDSDQEFVRELRSKHPDLASDPDTLAAIFYLNPGDDFRQKNYTYRIALTVVDELAQFGSENMGIFSRNDKVQAVVGALLKRFAAVDLQETDSSKLLLQRILQSTLNGLFDARSYIDSGVPLVESLFDALYQARESVPEGERDNFLMGLLNGKGYPRLIAQLMEESAGWLESGDEQAFKKLTISFLGEIASQIKDKPHLDGFFNAYWGDMLRAALRSVQQNSSVLFSEEQPLLEKTVLNIVGEIADASNAELLSSDILYSIVETAVATVAENPGIAADGIKWPWLSAFVQSVVDTVADEGIQKTFSKSGLNSLTSDVLSAFAAQPELLIKKPDLGQVILKEVMSSLSQADKFSAEVLAKATLTGLTDAISANPQLIDTPYAPMIAEIAGKVGEMVKENQISRKQAQAILKLIMAKTALNPAFFTQEKHIILLALQQLVKLSKGEFLLGGEMLSRTYGEVLQALALQGKKLLEARSIEELEKQLGDLLTAGLDELKQRLGKGLVSENLPAIAGQLVTYWGADKLDSFKAENPQFAEVFDLATNDLNV